MDAILQWMSFALAIFCVVVIVGIVVGAVVTGAVKATKALTELFVGRRRRAVAAQRQQAETVLRAIAVKRLLDQEAFRAQQRLMAEARQHLDHHL